MLNADLCSLLSHAATPSCSSSYTLWVIFNDDDVWFILHYTQWIYNIQLHCYTTLTHPQQLQMCSTLTLTTFLHNSACNTLYNCDTLWLWTKSATHNTSGPLLPLLARPRLPPGAAGVGGVQRSGWRGRPGHSGHYYIIVVIYQLCPGCKEPFVLSKSICNFYRIPSNLIVSDKADLCNSSENPKTWIDYMSVC